MSLYRDLIDDQGWGRSTGGESCSWTETSVDRASGLAREAFPKSSFRALSIILGPVEGSLRA